MRSCGSSCSACTAETVAKSCTAPCPCAIDVCACSALLLLLLPVNFATGFMHRRVLLFQVTPPWIPAVADDFDTSNISAEFTAEPCAITPSPAGFRLRDAIGEEHAPSFDGFTYVQTGGASNALDTRCVPCHPCCCAACCYSGRCLVLFVCSPSVSCFRMIRVHCVC